MNEAVQQSTGAVRGVVQTLVAYLIVQLTPILEALNVDSVQAEALIVAAVMGLYWIVMNAIQSSPVVQNNPVIAAVVAILMGGGQPPTYVDVEISDV